MAWYLQQADGTEIDLNASPYYAVEGVSGALFAPVQYQAMRTRAGGEVVSDAHLVGRRVDLPLFLRGRAGAGLRGALAKLLDAFSVDPAKPSYLVWRGQANRRLAVLLRGGAHWSDKQMGVTYAKVVVPLYAPQPWWEDEAETSQVLSSIEGVPFFPTIIPVHLTPSGVYAQVSVDVAGKMAQPLWSVQGPASILKLENLTLSEAISFPSLVLGSGDVLSIDTRTAAIERGNAVTITRADGTSENGWQYMTSDSVLWWLQHGSNNIQISLVDGSVNTQVKMSWRNMWFSPWSEAEL